MKVILTNDAWVKMHTFVDLCKDEISGLGKVERDEDGDFIVTDVAIFDQTVSGSHSDIPAQALAKFQVEMMQKGENMKDWYLWWHSHANMRTFFSGRDVQTIDESTDFGVLLSIVTNHKHDFKARVDVYKPVRLYADLDVEVEEPTNEAMETYCQSEIDKKVKKPAYTPSNVHWNNGNKRFVETGGSRFYDEEDGYTPHMGFKSPSEFLPSTQSLLEKGEESAEEESNDITAKYEDYIEEKDALITEIRDAKKCGDHEAVAVGKQLLREHLSYGVSMGFENSDDVKV